MSITITVLLSRTAVARPEKTTLGEDAHLDRGKYDMFTITSPLSHF